MIKGTRRRIDATTGTQKARMKKLRGSVTGINGFPQRVRKESMKHTLT